MREAAVDAVALSCFDDDVESSMRRLDAFEYEAMMESTIGSKTRGKTPPSAHRLILYTTSTRNDNM